MAPALVMEQQPLQELVQPGEQKDMQQGVRSAEAGYWQQPLQLGQQQQRYLEQEQQQVPRVDLVGGVGVGGLTQDDLMQQVLLEHAEDHRLWHQQQQQQHEGLQGRQAAEVTDGGDVLCGEQQQQQQMNWVDIDAGQQLEIVGSSEQEQQQQQLYAEIPSVGLPGFNMGLDGEQQGQEQLSLPGTPFEDEALDAWLTGVLAEQAALCVGEESDLSGT
jgi:hypothetical protein